MPKPVPLVLVVKNGSKMRCRCSALNPGPLSRTAICKAGCPSSCAVGAKHGDLHGVRASGQGVLQNVAKNLLQPKRIDQTMQIDTRTLFPQQGRASLPLIDQVGPGLPPDGAHRLHLTLQFQGSGIVADLAVELLKVVLRFLNAVDQIQCFGPVLHFHLPAFPGKPDCGPGRCRSREPGRPPSDRWPPAAPLAASVPGPA